MNITNEVRREAEAILTKTSGIDTRKMLNRAPDKRPNIEPSEIDGGITIEQLENIGCPVFTYQGQVTIHGTWPELNSNFDALGYKSLIRNKNGSLGVKYTAIDATKKKTVARALGFSKSCLFSAHADSRGFTLSRILKTSDENLGRLRELVSGLPEGSYIGNAGIYRSKSMFGDFLFAEVYVSAIPVKRLWDFISYVTGGEIANQAALDFRLEEQRQRREQEHAEYERERAVEKEKMRLHVEAETEKLNAIIAERLVPVPSPENKVRYIMPGLFGFERKHGFAVVQYGKAFGRITRKTKVFRTIGDAIANINCELGRGKEERRKHNVYKVKA